MLVGGEIELGVQQIPELMSVNGAEIIGLLPGDLQTTTIFTCWRSPGAPKNRLPLCRTDGQRFSERPEAPLPECAPRYLSRPIRAKRK